MVPNQSIPTTQLEYDNTPTYMPVLLFNEIFASTLLCLVFVSLNYRKDLLPLDYRRDPILSAGANSLSLYAVTSITYKITGLNFANPVLCLVQVASAALYRD